MTNCFKKLFMKYFHWSLNRLTLQKLFTFIVYYLKSCAFYIFQFLVANWLYEEEKPFNSGVSTLGWWLWTFSADDRFNSVRLFVYIQACYTHNACMWLFVTNFTSATNIRTLRTNQSIVNPILHCCEHSAYLSILSLLRMIFPSDTNVTFSLVFNQLWQFFIKSIGTHGNKVNQSIIRRKIMD